MRIGSPNRLRHPQRRPLHAAQRRLHRHAPRTEAHNLRFPVDLIEVEDQAAPNDYIAGRVVLILNLT